MVDSHSVASLSTAVLSPGKSSVLSALCTSNSCTTEHGQSFPVSLVWRPSGEGPGKLSFARAAQGIRSSISTVFPMLAITFFFVFLHHIKCVPRCVCTGLLQAP